MNIRLQSSIAVLMLVWMLAPVGVSAAQTSPDLASIRTLLESTDASLNLDPVRKSQLIEEYRAALESLESEQIDRTLALDYAGVVTSGQLPPIPAMVVPTAPQTSVETLALDELERELTIQKTAGLQVQTVLEEAQQALSTAQFDVAKALVEAKQQQTRAHTAADDESGSIEADQLLEAKRLRRLSAARAANARVEMLQQRLLSRDTRIELWTARQRELKATLATITDSEAALQEAINAARQRQATAASEQAQLRNEGLAQASPQVQQLAAHNVDLAKRTAATVERTKGLAFELDELRAEQARVERYRDSVTQRLAVAGATYLFELGQELLDQRRALTRQVQVSASASSLDEEIARARLAHLKLEDQRDEDHGLPSTNTTTSELLEERALLLQRAITESRRYIDTLAAVQTARQTLDATRLQYQSLIDSRLLWTPSTRPFNVDVWNAIGVELAWLTNLANWRSVVVVTGWLTSVPGIALFLLAGLLLLSRGPLHARSNRHDSEIGKVKRDRLAYTWEAFAACVVHAAAGPLALGAIATFVNGDTVFAAQLATGLVNAAALWFLLGLFAQICAPDGLAVTHFHWSPVSARALQRNLPWLTVVLLPTTVLTSLVDGIELQAQTNGAGRLVFALGSVAIAYFAHRLLRPRAPLAQSLTAHDSRWRQLLGYLVYAIFVLAPLGLMVFSWMGYHYTALQLEEKIFVTACAMLGLTLLHNMGKRAVLVTERRMAFERLLAKRNAMRAESASRTASKDAGEGRPDTLDLAEADVGEVSGQMQEFLRMLSAFTSLAVLWWLWSDVTPALGVLDEMHVWRIESDALTGDERWIALSDLLLAGVAAFLTLFGARTVPGSLEMAVLRNSSLAPGTRYAVTTIIRYLIVLVGVLITLQLVGMQWSKLQWLVAAMGVGLGFGLQEIFANLISGLLILFERPIRVGDTVTVGGHTGTVSRIRIRATTLTDWDRKEQIIPNKTFITEQLTNWTLSDPITRLIVRVGVAYGSDVEVVHRCLTEVVRRNTRVVAEPPPAIFFTGFGDSSLNFEIRVFIQNMLDMMPLTHELHVAIERELQQRGITIPFPQRDIWVRSAVEHAPAVTNAQEGVRTGADT